LLPSFNRVVPDVIVFESKNQISIVIAPVSVIEDAWLNDVETAETSIALYPPGVVAIPGVTLIVKGFPIWAAQVVPFRRVYVFGVHHCTSPRRTNAPGATVDGPTSEKGCVRGNGITYRAHFFARYPSTI
jgi:hypothetical protein